MENSYLSDGSDSSKEGKFKSFFSKKSLKAKFNRRRHRNDSSKSSESSLDWKLSSKPSKPTSDTVSMWFTSFENLLLDKVALELFHKYLQSEFSDENLEFWMSCEEFKKADLASLASLSTSIYNEFIAIQSPKEVNLDSQTREKIQQEVKRPNYSTFSEAQHRIVALMEKDSYRRFLSSPALSTWAATNNLSLPHT